MGNAVASKFGSIFVRTDKPYYFSGEVVTGTVYLNIVEAGFPGHAVHIKVKGNETSDWEEHRTVSDRNSDGTSTSRTEVDRYHGRNQFYSHRVQIHQFDGKFLPQGQYAFPFQFTLFSHLPGSFDETGPRWKAQISYKVKAEVDSFQKDSKKIKHHQDLIVREPLKTQLQALAGEMNVKTKTFCCINQGESLIKCVFDKNNYLPGDQAFLWIDIDNSDCNLDVKEIRAVLTQSVVLRSNQGRQQQFVKTLTTERIDGIPARSHAKNENRKTMSVVLQNQSGSAEDRTIKPSTNGVIVKSQYSLSASAIMSGCTCCATHPTVSVPIEIVAPVPIQYGQVQQPSNWNPQTFEPVLFNFSDTNLYGKDTNTQQNINYPSQNQNLNAVNQNNNMQNQTSNTQYQYNGPN